MNGEDVRVLAAKLDGMSTLMKTKFEVLEGQISKLTESGVNAEMCQFRSENRDKEVQELSDEQEAQDVRISALDDRTVKVERVAWLAAIVWSTIGIPVLLFLMFQILTGTWP
jgi:hypothetical protein